MGEFAFIAFERDNGEPLIHAASPIIASAAILDASDTGP
jgi:hypothetical protein